MNVPEKVKGALARAPVLLLLMIMIAVCNPIRADAEETLDRDMPGFVKIGDYDVIQTNGRNLNAMFDYTAKLPENKQYIAYFKIDKKKSSSIYWYTYKEYWHTKPLYTKVNGVDNTNNPGVPTEANAKKNGVFNIVDVRNPSKSGGGKKTFYNYSKTKGGTQTSVGNGKVGTLHYFCTDAGTPTGDIFNQYVDKKTGTVTFYISPVIKVSDKPNPYYSCNSWFKAHGWSDQNYAHYKAHYNVKFVFKAETVKVTQYACMVGKRMKTSDTFKVQDRIKDKVTQSGVLRSVKPIDYFFRPKTKDGKRVLLKVKGTENPTVDYYPFDSEDSKAKAVRLVSPVFVDKKTGKPKDSSNLTVTYEKGGKQKTAACIGYTVYKYVDTNDDGKGDKKIMLANCQIEMKKDKSGQYRPKYVEETKKTLNAEKNEEAEEDTEDLVDTTDKSTNNDGSSTKQDKDTDSIETSLPASIWDYHVVVRSYKKYDKKLNQDKKFKPTTKDNDKNARQYTLKEWVTAMNALKSGNSGYWAMCKKMGIRHDSHDTTKEIIVDWLYAEVDTPPTVTLEQYYTTEDFDIETSENPSVDDSADLEYKHKNAKYPSKNAKYVKRKVLAQVNYGDPWVSYSVKQDKNHAYKLKDGSVYPTDEEQKEATAQKQLSTKFKDTKPVCGFTKKDLIPKNTYDGADGNTIEKSFIPCVINVKGEGGDQDSVLNNYLYEVRIKTDDDNKWTKYTAKDIWGDASIANGKLGSGSTDRSYTTYAPYMKRYVYSDSGADKLHRPKYKDSVDWCQDIYNMTHFIIPEIRGNVTIQAFYTTTCPVRVMTYVKDGGSYNLDKVEMHWCSSAINFHGSYDNEYSVDAIFNAQGVKAASYPYTVNTRRPTSFTSVAAAERYFPNRQRLEAENGNFHFKMPSQPCTVVIMLSEPEGKYFTQVQYVKTHDGKYHFISSWRQPIRNTTNGETCSHLVGYDEWGNPIYETFYHGSSTVRAFVSFPQYVSYDDGCGGLYGSLFGQSELYYEYDAKPYYPKVASSVPSIIDNPKYYGMNNNSDVYLTQKGHDVYEATGNKDVADYAARNPAGGDNTLVCYCIYEDIFDGWNNEQFNPKTGGDNPHTHEEQSIYWNWLLPNGFVWEDQDIEKDDTVDRTRYDQEYSNPFIAQVLGTNASAEFDAQQGIPTTDYVRTHAQVPRYETKGYWNKEMVDWAYKVYAVYVKQHKGSETIMAGRNDPDSAQWSDTACIPHHENKKECYCEFDLYTSEAIQQSQSTVVERHGVYYTLGDAEVWDPYYVTLKNDVFSDTSISKDGLVTLYGYGVKGGYASNARFFQTGYGGYQLPTLVRPRQYVNYGTYNDWQSDMDVESDLVNFEDDADKLPTKLFTKNDTVTFYDGLGKTYTLSDGSMGYKITVQQPSFPPEADLVAAGIFDSKNSVPEGIQVEPLENNGNHETCSIAYYKQIQCIPTDEYKTDKLIKTKIIDDGDDDVLVYTPTVCESKCNLDYTNDKRDADGIKLNPNDNYDQAVTMPTDDNGYSNDPDGYDTDKLMTKIEKLSHNFQLDREYTLTISCEGEASSLPGYGWQDYTRYLQRDENGIPVIEVKFPFPVRIPMRFLKNADVSVESGGISAYGTLEKADENNKGLYRYYQANTWIPLEMIDEDGGIIGTTNYTFFIPSWATEAETATVTFRSVALNCDSNCKYREFQHEETNDYMTEDEDEYDGNPADCIGTNEDTTGPYKIDGLQNKKNRNEYLGWASIPKETGKTYSVQENVEYDDGDTKDHEYEGVLSEYANDGSEATSPFLERDYVAYAIEHDTVTGRISNFQIIDVTDYPAWQSVFRIDKTNQKYQTALCGTAYRSGVCNEFGFTGDWGTRYTKPVVGVSNPTNKSNGTIGLGYKFRYKITTVGPYYNSGDKITIKPVFYFMNDKGEYLQENGTWSTSVEHRKPVDVYYSETVNGKKQNLVKVGSDADKNNRKSLNLLDDAWQTSPEAAWQVNKDRIDLTNATLKNDRVGTTEDQYQFGEIQMTPSMRLLVGDTHVSAHRGKEFAKQEDTEFDFNSMVYADLKDMESDPAKREQYRTLLKYVNSDKVLKSVQEWYGEYYLPSETYASIASWDTIKSEISQGFDGTEDCWLKGGRLVIAFNPVLTSETKQTLTYDASWKYVESADSANSSVSSLGCNMYNIENCVTSKMLSMGETLSFGSRDVIVYDFPTNYDPDNPPDPNHPNKTSGPPKAPSASQGYNSSGSH